MHRQTAIIIGAEPWKLPGNCMTAREYKLWMDYAGTSLQAEYLDYILEEGTRDYNYLEWPLAGERTDIGQKSGIYYP